MKTPRVAVLITGLPRFLESGSYWWKNRTFDFDVDFYMHLWGDEHDAERAKKLWDPVAISYHDQKKYMVDFSRKVREINNTLDPMHWNFMPEKYHNTAAFRKGLMNDSSRFWGQYLSTYEASSLVDYSKYDYIIKARSDVIIDDTYDWQECFEYIEHRGVFLHWPQNPHLDNNIINTFTIYTPDISLMSAIPQAVDLVFMAKSKDWRNLSCNIKNNIIDLVTKDKALFYELKAFKLKYVAHQHWIWNKLCSYAGQSIVTLSPRMYTCMLRKDVDLTSISFNDLTT